MKAYAQQENMKMPTKDIACSVLAGVPCRDAEADNAAEAML